MLLFSTKKKKKKTNGEKKLNCLNSESLKINLKIHNRKTIYTTEDAEDIPILQDKKEKVTIFKYLGRHTPPRYYKRRNHARNGSSLERF